MKSHYQSVNGGYQIIGSNEKFNRVLYGGHEQDHQPESYFTFAGDQPVIMGTVSDWNKQYRCAHAKCGIFMLGTASTKEYIKGSYKPGKWFHQSEGTAATFRNGWMEYKLQPFFTGGPVLSAEIKVLPLQGEDGFLFYLKIDSDQRVILTAAFGGITDFNSSPGWFESHYAHSADCEGNIVVMNGTGASASVRSSGDGAVQTEMLIGSTLPVAVSVGDAKQSSTPESFLRDSSEPIETPMIRMTCAINPGETTEGYFVVVRNADESALERWLTCDNPVETLEKAIRVKSADLIVTTPDNMLNQTVPANVTAMDACWHNNTFYHGAYDWHTPYMGWRNWYGPTVMGWHSRVEKAFRTHAACQVVKPTGEGARAEEVTFPGSSMYAQMKNSYGYIPEIPDGRTSLNYTMQEVGVDMILHNLEWTGDLAYAREVFDTISAVLDWEERLLDPDSDGLYQNFLNTWISDAHSYNGGGCAQSSVYNYRANKLMAKIAGLLGKDPEPFLHRVRKIRKACQEILWIPEKGVMAEYIDTIGNKLIHPSPELATIYHTIEMGMSDMFQSYQMLRFTETTLRNEHTSARNGRLVWSSEWYPQNYSSCGLYAAENIHLAWAYLACGQTEKGHEILAGIVDAHFMGKHPGLVAHCMSGNGYSDGAADFTEIPSMYLRLIVEGVFGINMHLIDGYVEISPSFPLDWDDAELQTDRISMHYSRKAAAEKFRISLVVDARGIIRFPLRSTKIQDILINGKSVDYCIEASIGFSTVIIETDEISDIELTVIYAEGILPFMNNELKLREDEYFTLTLSDGSIREIKDPSGCLQEIAQNKQTIRAQVHADSGNHTIFVLAEKDEWIAWLPVHITIESTAAQKKNISRERGYALEEKKFIPVDISSFFNCSLQEIHSLEYWNPRPEGFSIMTFLNGRFGWDWNQRGHNAVEVDDTSLRKSGGSYQVPSGIEFNTPEAGANVVCASIWENFPDMVEIPLSGKAEKLAVFFIGITNPMQSRVENGRFVVAYVDGTEENVSLINPDNFDDWLNAAYQKENEIVYFSDYNHGMVQKIALDPAKELKSLTVTAVANEVIIGIMGISIAYGRN